MNYWLIILFLTVPPYLSHYEHICNWIFKTTSIKRYNSSIYEFLTSSQLVTMDYYGIQSNIISSHFGFSFWHGYCWTFQCIFFKKLNWYKIKLINYWEYHTIDNNKSLCSYDWNQSIVTKSSNSSWLEMKRVSLSTRTDATLMLLRLMLP